MADRKIGVAVARRSLDNAKREPIGPLIESAFDFLMRAAAEISTHPKYSIINFATAIELMLKARLMREHWSLVVERSSEAVKQDFLEGKARTISAREAIRRLKNVCDETIPPSARQAFEGIADHRNKVIHFVHEATTGTPTAQVLETITREQCVGWYHLERLLKIWGEPFSLFKQQLTNVKRLMHANQQYLSAVFDAEKADIDKQRSEGALFATCGGCGFASAKCYSITDRIQERSCLVCDLHEHFIQIKCPNDDCGAEVDIVADHGSERTCLKCNEDITQALEAALDTRTPEDYLIEGPINCVYCTGMGTVVEHVDKIFVCLECLQYEAGIRVCKWCNEGQIGGGDLEHSYYSGCEFCDGHAGTMRDD